MQFLDWVKVRQFFENVDMPPIADLDHWMSKVVKALQPLYSADLDTILKLQRKQDRSFAEVLHGYLQKRIHELLQQNSLEISNPAIKILATGAMAEITDIWMEEYQNAVQSGLIN